MTLSNRTEKYLLSLPNTKAGHKEYVLLRLAAQEVSLSCYMHYRGNGVGDETPRHTKIKISTHFDVYVKERLRMMKGVIVPHYVADNPELITVGDIDKMSNLEVRRIMISQYGGVGRYLLDSGAVEIHRDDFGILYHKDIPNGEPLVIIKVVNATPEADGSFKDYFLRVPPRIKKAKEAVAWTFDKTEKEYDLAQQT